MMDGGELGVRATARHDSWRQVALAERLAGIGHWQFDPKTRTFDLSDGALRMLGMEPPAGPPTLDDLLARVAPDDRGRVGAGFDDAIRNGAELSVECSVDVEVGPRRLVHWRGLTADDGDGATRLAGYVRDLSAERRAEAERMSSDQRFFTLLDNMRNIILLRSRVDDEDMRAATVYGADAGAITGVFGDGPVHKTRWLEAIHPEDLPEYLEAEALCRREGVPFNLQFRFRHGETGVVKWARQVGWIVRDGGEQFFESYLLDVTDLIAAQETAYAAKLQAERASQAKSDFLASMSYELRTPMNAILGFTQVIGEELFGPLGNDRYVEYIGHIDESSRHLLGLINDLLDVRKIEAYDLDLRETELDLAEAVHSAAGLIRPTAASKNISVAIDHMGRIGLMADKRALRQILFNLLSNAIKFTDRGGRIDVGAERLADGATRIFVTDNGCGIPPEDISRIMEPFSQINATHVASAERGVGLGLFLVQRLAEWHEASVQVQSRPHDGTTVSVVFPAARALGA